VIADEPVTELIHETPMALDDRVERLAMAGQTCLDELGVSGIGHHDLDGAASDPRPYVCQHASLLDQHAGAKVKRKGR
jgi:hypothetical protein